MRTDRGCVADQPQRVEEEKPYRIIQRINHSEAAAAGRGRHSRGPMQSAIPRFTRMILRPANITELSNFLSCAHTRGEKISSVDLSALNRVLEHKAEDMTATVEAGMTLADFQKQLSTLGQWLPIDPSHPDKLSIGDLLSKNLSGPRRFGYGTVGE